MRILIVEDEPFVQQDLRETLEELGHEVAGTAESYEEVEAFIAEGKTADVAFLDIQLATDLDGVDVGTLLKRYGILQFVFLTSLVDDRTLKRVKQLDASGYIVKPFKQSDIKTTLALLPDKTAPAVIDRGSDYFLVKEAHEYRKIALSDLRYVEACDNYVKLHTATGKHLLNMTLKAAMDKLPEDRFERCHRSFIVNVECIDRIGPNYIVIGKEEIPINEEFKKTVQARYEKF
jgi:two-component system, LytTR family, response regulator LytT